MGNEGAHMHASVTSTIVSIACVIFVETVERLNYKKIQFAIPLSDSFLEEDCGS